MATVFRCDICGALRDRDEGEGDWFSVGVNRTEKTRSLNVYAWPLGCKSQSDDSVHHFCGAAHLGKFVIKWAGGK